MKIIFVDLDKEICDLVKQYIPKLEVINYSLDNVEGDILSTCSNPSFSMGGGLDKYIKNRFFKNKDNFSQDIIETGDKKIKYIFPNITVDCGIETSKELVMSAYLRYFYFCKKYNYENVLITAFGTGIGGFNKFEMVEALKESLKIINY